MDGGFYLMRLFKAIAKSKRQVKRQRKQFMAILMVCAMLFSLLPPVGVVGTVEPQYAASVTQNDIKTYYETFAAAWTAAGSATAESNRATVQLHGNVCRTR